MSDVLEGTVVDVHGDKVRVRFPSGAIVGPLPCVGGTAGMVPGDPVVLTRTSNRWVAQRIGQVSQAVGGAVYIVQNVQPPEVVAAPTAHAATHQDGGVDEINVSGLSGVLADPQNAGWLRGTPISLTPPGEADSLIYSVRLGSWIPGRTIPVEVHYSFLRLPMWALSWAQFGIEEVFDNEDYRADSEPAGTEPAVIIGGRLTTASPATGVTFSWTSKTYTNITTVYQGTSSATGSGYLEDSNADGWFENRWANYVLVDASSNRYTILSNTDVRLNLDTNNTPASGNYSIVSRAPNWAAAWMSYSGQGNIRLEFSTDGGASWGVLFLDTSLGINKLGGAVPLTGAGDDFLFRILLENPTSGNGAPYVDHVLIVTGPSVWG